MGEAERFDRRIDALDAIFGFTARRFAEAGIPQSLLPTVDFVIEELFTNRIKYGRGGAQLTLEVRAIAGGVEVTMLDEGTEHFDPSAQPPVDVSAPMEQRQPGGLGLHLIRRLVDFLEYDRQPATGLSRITFRKTEPSPPPSP